VSDYEQIETEQHDGVRLVALNRPDRLNAWTPQLALELADALERANEDAAVGAIVLTGRGRGFCAGADMDLTFSTRLSGHDPGGDTAGGVGGFPAGLDWIGLCRRSKPLVAAVNGAAVGVGVTMILPFDLILAATTARFGLGFIKVGLVPELASSQLLPQRVGVGFANDLCLTGRIVDAAEAARNGLVDRQVEPDELVPAALTLATEIGRNPGPQLRMTKQLLALNLTESDIGVVQQRESDLLHECWKSPEHAEAVRAFLEKRPPDFSPSA
jgi:enoyl-CoA hydratase/carnithine racemase